MPDLYGRFEDSAPMKIADDKYTLTEKAAVTGYTLDADAHTVSISGTPGGTEYVVVYTLVDDTTNTKEFTINLTE